MVPKNYALIINHSNFISGSPGYEDSCTTAKEKCSLYDKLTRKPRVREPQSSFVMAKKNNL